MDLRVDNPTHSDGFARSLARHGVKLPLRMSAEEIGVVVDADGEDVFTVDVNGDLSDEGATEIAFLIMLAVNTCGGQKAEVVHDA